MPLNNVTPPELEPLLVEELEVLLDEALEFELLLDEALEFELVLEEELELDVPSEAGF